MSNKARLRNSLKTANLLLLFAMVLPGSEASAQYIAPAKVLPVETQIAPITPSHVAVGHVNADIELQALVRTDRLPRSKKFLWLMPGKVYRWYYAWVLQDGSTVTKVEVKQIKGIQDDRPFAQAHPNLSLAYLGATASAGLVGGLVSGAISRH